MKKIRLSLIFSLLLAVVFAGSAFSESSEPAGRVKDDIGILNAEVKESLEKILAKFEAKTGAKIRIITVSSFEGFSADAYVNSDIERVIDPEKTINPEKKEKLEKILADNMKKSGMDVRVAAIPSETVIFIAKGTEGEIRPVAMNEGGWIIVIFIILLVIFAF